MAMASICSGGRQLHREYTKGRAEFGGCKKTSATATKKDEKAAMEIKNSGIVIPLPTLRQGPKPPQRHSQSSTTFTLQT